MKVCIWRANAEICLRETCGLQQTGLSMKLDQNRMSQFALITRFPDLFLLLFSHHIHPTLIFPVSQVPNSSLWLLCLFSSLQSDIIFSNFSILLKPMNRFVIQTHTGLYDIIHIIDYVSGVLIENGLIIWISHGQKRFCISLGGKKNMDSLEGGRNRALTGAPLILTRLILVLDSLESA